MNQSSTNLSVSYYTIDDNQVDQRIDNFLINQLKGVPKSRIYRIIRKGEVRVNKKRVKPEYKLKYDDTVRVPPIRLESTGESSGAAIPNSNIQFLEQRILFENDALIVIDKPAGMAVHGGSGLSYGLIEAMRALRPTARYLELVHRLDRDTSGCLMIAKKRSMLRHLHAQLTQKRMGKYYRVLAHGFWPKSKQVVKAPLKKNQLSSGERMVKVSADGKEAITRFRVLEHFDSFTMLEAFPVTGRTHQIRVHCQSQGCPIAGDVKYSSEAAMKVAREHAIKRLCLHAERIEFEDMDGKRQEFTAPLDDAWQSIIDSMIGKPSE